MLEAISKIQISENWHYDRKDGDFTGDHVIDAYLKGKRDGLQSHQKTLLNSLKTNVDHCAQYAHDIIRHLTELKFNDSTAFLKINRLDNFKVLIAIKEDDFLNPGFLKIYDYVCEIEENICNDTFNVDFTFLDYNKEINENNLNSDGFILKLKESNEAKARRA